MGELGQVFTPGNVASLMREMLFENAGTLDSQIVLDPCIGQNIFLEHIAAAAPTVPMHGVEIDAGLLDARTTHFYRPASRELVHANFFDFAETCSAKYDFIITNPPYVRHEKMAGENDKKTIRARFAAKDYIIPTKSNLYVYFLLKAIDLLKPQGRMVAIVYDSWLYSAYGEIFQATLSTLGSIDAVVHFRHEAFTNADVGATIIRFTKSTPQNQLVQFASYDTAGNVGGLQEIGWETKNVDQMIDSRKADSDNPKLVPLGTVAEINRGTSALSNKLFVFKDPVFQDMVPIIKSVKGITGMTAVSDRYLLMAAKDPDAETTVYLDTIKQHVLDNPAGFTSLARNIEADALWYRPRLAQPGDIIFNYYLRDTADFISNPDRIQSSDNFYNLRFSAGSMVYLSLLNSTYVKNAVLSRSRHQGSGLRKIQLYEFKQVLIPNIDMFSSESRQTLRDYGTRLSKQLRTSDAKTDIIRKIDNVINNELNSGGETPEILYSNKQYGAAVV